MSVPSSVPVRRRRTGYLAFFLSGICAISSGVVVSVLQEHYALPYGLTGTLLSCMSTGNLLAAFLAGVLPGKIGLKRTILLLGTGYCVGYAMMGLGGWTLLLAAAFFLVGLAKGSVLNVCTILVGDNTPERTRGMNTMHSFYACGALLCPFLVTAALRGGDLAPMFVLSALGALLWLTFAAAPVGSASEKKAGGQTNWSFLRSSRFWLLTALLFCQNGAETSVTGWLVTYFKDCGILSAAISPYTVTVLWGVTMVMRLVLAFVFPPKNAYRAMVWMGLGCSIFYCGLMLAKFQVPALLLLALFSLSIAGMNPTAVAAAGRMTSVTSMGVMLPAAGLGAIVMPWLIGLVAEHSGIAAGMAVNLIPCVGMLVFALLVKQTAKKEKVMA